MAKQDYKTQGIKIHYQQNYRDYYLWAEKDGDVVGKLILKEIEDTKIFSPIDVRVEFDFRRMGIASAMYELFESETGYKIEASDELSEEASLFWKQKDRKFGF